MLEKMKRDEMNYQVLSNMAKIQYTGLYESDWEYITLLSYSKPKMYK